MCEITCFFPNFLLRLCKHLPQQHAEVSWSHGSSWWEHRLLVTIASSVLIEQPRLEGPWKDWLVQPFIGVGTPDCILKASVGGDSTTSLGWLFQLAAWPWLSATVDAFL